MTVTFAQVSKVFQGKTAVDQLSLEVKTGELLVYIGPSGCGKTTTLRMVNRLEEPTSGSIQIDGQDIKSYNSDQLRRGIGYTVQQTGLFPHMTIRDNIDVVPKLLGWPKAKREARIRELLSLVDMSYDEFAHRYPRQLSGGQQQRIGVLRSLAADPPIILMDEPFGALDPISREVLQNELKTLQSRLQKTIIFVTHDMDEALRIGDRVAVFQQGKLVQLGTPEDIVQRPSNDFVASFVGRKFAFGGASPSTTAVDVADTRLQLYAKTDVGTVYSVPSSNAFYLVNDANVFVGRLSKESVLTEQYVPANNSKRVHAEAPLKEVFDLCQDLEPVPVVDASEHLVGVITPSALVEAAARLLGGERP